MTRTCWHTVTIRFVHELEYPFLKLYALSPQTQERLVDVQNGTLVTLFALHIDRSVAFVYRQPRLYALPAEACIVAAIPLHRGAAPISIHVQTKQVQEELRHPTVLPTQWILRCPGWETPVHHADLFAIVRDRDAPNRELKQGQELGHPGIAADL